MKEDIKELNDISDDIQKYIFCMNEIKKRIYVISQFLDNRASTGQPITDIEFLCLQFRKVLEFIALSSLSANRNKYEEVREDFKTDWHAKRILEKIEKLNPNFYPCPTKQIIDNKTGMVIKVEAIKEGFLTREEFIKIYDECSIFLHAYNPYSFKSQNLSNQINKFILWNKLIIKLLNHHQVRLVNDSRQLWTIMKAEKDGKVHVFEMLKIEKEK